MSVSRHFLLQAPQCPCYVRKRFSRDHCEVPALSATGMKRMGSVKSRKVSTQSLQSTTSAEEPALSTFVNFDDTPAAAAAAPTVPDTPYDEGQDIPTDLRDAGDELDYCHNMPWIRVSSYVSH